VLLGGLSYPNNWPTETLESDFLPTDYSVVLYTFLDQIKQLSANSNLYYNLYREVQCTAGSHLTTCLAPFGRPKCLCQVSHYMLDNTQFRCVDTMRHCIRVIESLPCYLEAKVKYTLGKAKNVYLRFLLGYVSDRVLTWTNDMQALDDSNSFDFLELKCKPLLFSAPSTRLSCTCSVRRPSCSSWVLGFD